MRPDRATPVQPDVRDDGRRAAGRGLACLPAAGDRAGNLHQLQERPPDRETQAAVRNRPDREVVSQRDHSRQLPLPRARVRADGDGVLRPAGRGRQVVPLLDRRAAQLVPPLRPARQQASCARARARGTVALLTGNERHRVRLPDRLGRARGHCESRRLRPDAAHRALDDEARVRRTGRRALRPVRDRARSQHRADHGRACSSTRTTRRSSATASEPSSACIRRSRRSRPPFCRSIGKNDEMVGKARGLYEELRRQPQRGVRRRWRDRQPLPPPGRDRHTVGVHRRRADARGRHGDGPRPRFTCARTAADRRRARLDRGRARAATGSRRRRARRCAACAAGSSRSIRRRT